MEKKVNKHVRIELNNFRNGFPSLPFPSKAYLEKIEKHYSEYGRKYLRSFFEDTELDFVEDLEFSIQTMLSEVEIEVNPFMPNPEEVQEWILLMKEGGPVEAMQADWDLGGYHINIHDTQTVRIWRTYLSFLQSRRKLLVQNKPEPVTKFTYREVALILSYLNIRITNSDEARNALDALPMKGNLELKNAESQLIKHCSDVYGESSRLEALEVENNGRAVKSLQKSIERVREHWNKDEAELELQIINSDLDKIDRYLKMLKPL
jgi:hypothetical protein